MKAVIGGVQTPYQVVTLTRQLLDHRVLPKAISYIARYIEEVAVLVPQSVEVAAPDAARNVIDNWIIPQPEATRLTRRSFVEAGLADLKGPEIEGYGKLLGHGWLLKLFTAEAIAAKPMPPALATVKSLLDAGSIVIGCQLDDFIKASAMMIFRERGVQNIAEIDF